MKKIVATILAIVLAFSMLSLTGIVSAKVINGRGQLYNEINIAKSMLYQGNSEQTRKYLDDRIERAKALYYDKDASDDVLRQEAEKLVDAELMLKPMNDCEVIGLQGFKYWTDEDVRQMVECTGKVFLDTENKPEGTDFSVCVAPADGVAVLSNGATRSGVAGSSPFGIDMNKADGIRFWVSCDSAADITVEIGKRSNLSNYIFSFDGLRVMSEGYVFIPFEKFVPYSDDAVMEKDGSMNYIRITANTYSPVRFADFTAYDEILETSTKTAYSETKAASRNQIVDNAYYKILESSSGKAVTLGPEITETKEQWQDCLSVTDSSLSYYLDENREGDRTQMWQLSPSPSGNGSFRLINKSCSNALTLSESGGSVEAREVQMNNKKQEWSLSASGGGNFTIQIRNAGKLTTAGDTVKATTGSTYKKFYLYKVVETEYVSSWSDEFDGTELDRSKWNVDDGFYFGGGVSTIHTDDDDNKKVEDGELVLTATPDRYDGYEVTGTYMSTSGRFAFSYGKVEIRAKLAYGNGQFPALWMMPSDLMNMGAGEIDIMEMVVEEDISKNGTQIGTIHWTTDDGITHKSKVLYMPIPDNKYLSDDYHTYGVEMDHGQVRYYFDGMQYMSLNINSEGKEYAFGDMDRYIIINNSTKGDGVCMINQSWGVEEKYETRVDYVRCFMEAGELSDNTVDLTTEDSIKYSSDINAVGTNDCWDTNLPMDINPDGTEGAAAEYSGKLFIFDPTTNVTKKVINMFVNGSSLVTRPHRVVYSPDGSKLVVATNQGVIAVYDTSDYDKVPIVIYNGCVIQENVLITNDSSQIVVGGYNGGSQAYKNPINSSITEKWKFRVFDINTGARLHQIDVGGDPRYITLTEDGTMAAVTTTRNGLFLYNTEDWSEYAHINAHLNGDHKYAIRGADFSSDGKKLVTSDEGGKINIWDVENKVLLKSMNNVNTGSVRRVLFSPDNDKVLATGTYGAARLFDVESGELVSLLGGFGNVIREIAYSPDGKYIVAASYDCSIKVFAADGTYLDTLLAGDVHSQGFIISRLKFTPDSEYVFASTRSEPAFIQKWALPKETDKKALISALKDATPGSQEYEYALAVSQLKYATPKMVYTALEGIALLPAVYYDSSEVSANAVDYAGAVSVNLNGYVYLHTVTQASADDVSVEIRNTDNDETETVSLNKDNLLKYEVTNGNLAVERLCKIKMSAGGNYTLGLKDNKSDRCFNTVSVTVDPTKRDTDEFAYKIVNNEAWITACISGERDVVVPDNIEGYPVTTIDQYAFKNYGRIIPHMTLVLPSTLKTIKQYAFAECDSMRRLVLPEGLERIESYAFRSCRLLGIVNIPSTITSAASSCFTNCTGIGTVITSIGTTKLSGSAFNATYRIRELIFAEGLTEINGVSIGTQYLMESVYIPASVTKITGNIVSGNRNIVTIYGVAGSQAETFANQYPTKYRFVALGTPVISGVENNQTFDMKDGAVPSATWDNGTVAFLNGSEYKAGTPIAEPGNYTLKVVNGYETYSTEISFSVVDTTPEPVVDGIEDGAEYDLYDGEPVSLTWTPAEATATLNGTAYTSGTEITEPGEYKLVVTNGTKTTEINFTVKDTSTVPVISGIEEGREYDLYAGEKPSATWDAGEATLNGEPYAAGTAIETVGDYTLKVTNGTKSAEVSFKVVDNTPPYTLGDFDNDGQITVADALAALRIGAKLVEETPETIAIGDVDNDGHVTVADALAILRVAAKLVDHF